MSFSYLFNDEYAEVRVLVLEEGNDVVEEDVEVLVSVSKGND